MLSLLRKINPLYFLLFAWAQSLFAMGGSLYFSEILHYPPCVLCWYQRIAMYPFTLLLPIGIARKDRNIFFYTLPLVTIGWIISIYHNLLYYKILPESIAPCVAGISCTTKYVEFLGFITIPLLSFVAHTVILLSLLAYYHFTKNKKNS